MSATYRLEKGKHESASEGRCAMDRRCNSEAGFWAKMLRSPEPDGCWLWNGRRTASGYGMLGFDGKHQRVSKIVNRRSYTHV